MNQNFAMCNSFRNCLGISIYYEQFLATLMKFDEQSFKEKFQALFYECFDHNFYAKHVLISKHLSLINKLQFHKVESVTK